MKRLRRAAFKKWDFSHDPKDRTEYKKSVAIAKRTFKTKKKEYFKKFASTLNSRSNQSFVWNKCKILQNSLTKTDKFGIKEHLQNNENLHLALNKICPPWVPTDPDFLPPSTPNPFFDAPYTFTEFNVALENKNTKSSPGIDGIDFQVLQALPIKLKLLLLDILNEMFSENRYPTSWKHSYLHFILKSDGKTFRPIALTSCIAKLFETMTKNRLEWWLEYHNLLPNDQQGFRKGRSCTDSLLYLTLTIREAFKEKKEVLAAFLDVHAAFDNINIDILLAKLSELGCSEKILLFIKHLTRERFIHTDLLEEKFYITYKGVPQGGVLSPLLYIIYVAHLTSGLSKRILTCQFADDLALFIKFQVLQRATSSLQKSINEIKMRLHNLGLELTTSKTVLVHFNNKKITPGSVSIVVDECEIKSSPNARFLGLIFDYGLTFKPHINTVQKKCLKAINIVKFLCGTWWGSDPCTIITIYKSFVRSILDYGSFIYLPSNQKYTQILEKIQYIAIRAALGLRRSTPTNILLAEAKLTTIFDRAILLGECYISKILSNIGLPAHNLTQKHFKSLKKIDNPKLPLDICIKGISNYANVHKKNKYPIFEKDFDVLFTKIPFNTELGLSLKKSKNPTVIFEEFLNKSTATAIYTDGSKMTNSISVGSACFCPSLQVQELRSFDKRTSVYFAECSALNDAFTLALTHKNLKFFIFSDSLSSLQALNSAKASVKTNQFILDIKEKYLASTSTSSEAQIELYWIPSHIGIPGNEEADRLAKQASQSPCLQNTQIHYTDLREEFKRAAFLRTKEKTQTQGLLKGKTYFELYDTKKRLPWFQNLSHKSREFIVTINRCRSNHYHLAQSLFRINVVDSPLCKCNLHEENLNHVLWQCSLYNPQRNKLLVSLRRIGLSPPLNVESIVAIPNIKACEAMFQFFNECSLRI